MPGIGTASSGRFSPTSAAIRRGIGRSRPRRPRWPVTNARKRICWTRRLAQNGPSFRNRSRKGARAGGSAAGMLDGPAKPRRRRSCQSSPAGMARRLSSRTRDMLRGAREEQKRLCSVAIGSGSCLRQAPRLSCSTCFEWNADAIYCQIARKLHVILIHSPRRKRQICIKLFINEMQLPSIGEHRKDLLPRIKYISEF